MRGQVVCRYRPQGRPPAGHLHEAGKQFWRGAQRPYPGLGGSRVYSPAGHLVILVRNAPLPPANTGRWGSGRPFRVLPHGPCIPRPCRPHLAAKPCPTMPLLIQKETRHELSQQAWFRAMSASLSAFTLFSSKNILFILVIFLYFFFIKKWKSRQKHRKPLCCNCFQVSTFCFLVPFLWTGAPLHPTLHQTKSRRNGV